MSNQELTKSLKEIMMAKDKSSGARHCETKPTFRARDLPDLETDDIDSWFEDFERLCSCLHFLMISSRLLNLENEHRIHL